MFNVDFVLCGFIALFNFIYLCFLPMLNGNKKENLTSACRRFYTLAAYENWSLQTVPILIYI